MAKCECGCGQDTSLVTRTRPHLGVVRDTPRRFIAGHQRRGRQCHRVASVRQYRTVLREPNSPSVALHRVRAERALGKSLPVNAIVHHADGSKRDDAPLVICQDQKYHHLLHARMRIKAAGGNPNTDAVCRVCRSAKPRAEFSRHASRIFGVSDACRECTRVADRARRAGLR